jgi:hypothetical protein
MTIIVFEGVTKDGDSVSFKRSGGCLCILGKSPAHLSEINDKMDSRRMVEIQTLTFKDILCESNHFKTPADCKENEVILKRFMKMFPEMRTCISSPKSILSGKGATFDAKRYSLNEIMFAMFHLRTMVSNYSYLKHKAVRGVDLIRHLMTKHNYPFWKVYLASLLKIASCESYINERPYTSHCDIMSKHLGGWDASCFNWKCVEVETFCSLLEGNPPKFNARRDTMMDHLNDNLRYHRNIQAWLSSDATPRNPTHKVLGRVRELMSIKARSSASSQSGVGNLFNSSSSIDEVRWSDVNNYEQLLSESIDQAFEEHGIDTTSFMK